MAGVYYYGFYRELFRDGGFERSFSRNHLNDSAQVISDKRRRDEYGTAGKYYRYVQSSLGPIYQYPIAPCPQGYAFSFSLYGRRLDKRIPFPIQTVERKGKSIT